MIVSRMAELARLDALLAGLVSFKLLKPEQTPAPEPATTDSSRVSATHVKAKR